jgi:hypothetical protein
MKSVLFMSTLLTLTAFPAAARADVFVLLDGTCIQGEVWCSTSDNLFVRLPNGQSRNIPKSLLGEVIRGKDAECPTAGLSGNSLATIPPNEAQDEAGATEPTDAGMDKKVPIREAHEFLAVLRARSESVGADVDAAIRRIQLRHRLEEQEPANVRQVWVARIRWQLTQKAVADLRASGAREIKKTLEFVATAETGQPSPQPISVMVTPTTATKALQEAKQALEAALGVERRKRELRPYYLARRLSRRTDAFIRQAERDLATLADTPDSLAEASRHWEKKISDSILATRDALAIAVAANRPYQGMSVQEAEAVPREPADEAKRSPE